MIDLSAQNQLIPLSQVPKLSWIPRRRGAKRLHAATVFRWVQKGIRGIRLESVQFGGTKVTTVAALQRFFRLLAGGNVVSGRTSPAARQRAIDQAEQELDRLGM